MAVQGGAAAYPPLPTTFSRKGDHCKPNLEFGPFKEMYGISVIPPTGPPPAGFDHNIGRYPDGCPVALQRYTKLRSGAGSPFPWSEIIPKVTRHTSLIHRHVKPPTDDKIQEVRASDRPARKPRGDPRAGAIPFQDINKAPMTEIGKRAAWKRSLETMKAMYEARHPNWREQVASMPTIEDLPLSYKGQVRFQLMNAREQWEYLDTERPYGELAGLEVYNLVNWVLKTVYPKKSPTSDDVSNEAGKIILRCDGENTDGCIGFMSFLGYFEVASTYICLNTHIH